MVNANKTVSIIHWKLHCLQGHLPHYGSSVIWFWCCWSWVSLTWLGGHLWTSAGYYWRCPCLLELLPVICFVWVKNLPQLLQDHHLLSHLMWTHCCCYWWWAGVWTGCWWFSPVVCPVTCWGLLHYMLWATWGAASRMQCWLGCPESQGCLSDSVVESHCMGGLSASNSPSVTGRAVPAEVLWVSELSLGWHQHWGGGWGWADVEEGLLHWGK